MADTTTAARGADLRPADLAALRKHVVHTADGRLDETSTAKPADVDAFATTAADVRRMVEEDLAQFVEQQAGKASSGEAPAPVPVPALFQSRRPRPRPPRAARLPLRSGTMAGPQRQPGCSWPGRSTARIRAAR